ncbi:MAG TPA: hypothetical protein QGH10_01720 [Armatimonadota bacterium]|nr:hypothetical protein [Armatimonadota bacterium]
MTALPTTNIGGVEVTRMACGSNNFFGYSHLSAARDAWLVKHFTDERLYEMLQCCAKLGVNLFVSGPQERFASLRRRLEDETGFRIKWACTPFGETLDELKQSVDTCREWDVEICLPHTSVIERNLNLRDREITELPEALAYIRSVDMVPGISTHRPEAVPLVHELGYDVETAILPLNALGFLCQVEVEWQERIIRSFPKPIITIKPLAAGRITPIPGFTFVYQRIKPIDTVAVGVLCPEELEEDVNLAASLMTGEEGGVALSTSRSKAHMGTDDAAGG